MTAFFDRTPSFLPGGGLSVPGNTALDKIFAISDAGPSSATTIASSEQHLQANTLDNRIFNETSFYKTYTAAVAMHLTGEWRDNFFKQIDRLIDPENWDDEDELISRASFQTLIKLVTLPNVTVRPSINVSQFGDAMATWARPEGRLTVYCRPNENIQWVVQSEENGFWESATGQTHLSRLLPAIEPYGVTKWLKNPPKQNTETSAMEITSSAT